VQGVAGVVLTLAIASITLGLTQQHRLGERLGSNLRFAALGGAAGAGMLGLVGAHVSQLAVFLLAAAFGIPALLALTAIRAEDLARAAERSLHLQNRASVRRGRRRRAGPPHAPVPHLLASRPLQILLACVVLFHLANAGMLPLAAGTLAQGPGSFADLVIGGAVVEAQLITAAASPQAGRLAHRVGRRPVLLAAFVLLILRGALFTIDGAPALILAAQCLDGLIGAAFGVLVPLIVADITHDKGRFNLALGMVGLATGLGASVSTYAAGHIAQMTDPRTAFAAMTAAAIAAAALVGLAMPETADLAQPRPVTA